MTPSKIRTRSPLAPIGGALAVVLCAGSASLLVFACGRTADVDPADGGSEGGAAGGGTGDARPPGFDGSLNPLADAGTSPIDAGSPPIVPCADGGMTCAAPPSDCLDEHTMRYFSGGTCNDAGTCDYMIFTMTCDPSPMPPDCYQGGCRVVIVR